MEWLDNKKWIDDHVKEAHLSYSLLRVQIIKTGLLLVIFSINVFMFSNFRGAMYTHYGSCYNLNLMVHNISRVWKLFSVWELFM